MTFSYPDEIDLTLPDDEVARQPPGNMCMAFAAVNALQIMANRDPAWKGKKFSQWFLYWYGRIYQGGTGDSGMRPGDASEVLKRHGLCELADFNPQDITVAPGLAANLKAQYMAGTEFWYTPYHEDNIRETLIRSLCFGIPPVIVMKVNNDFGALEGSWRLMDHDASTPGGYDHAMTVVGYSKHYDTFKCKNSWGPDKGEGGYYGLKAEKFYPGPQNCVASIWRIEKSPIKPVKVEGFMPGIPSLTPSQSRDFVTLMKPTLLGILSQAFVSGGTLGLRDKCIELGVSDVLAEEILGIQRGEAQAWFNSQNVPQGAMIWYPLI